MMIKGNIDTLVVTESKKIDNSFPAQQFDIQGYARPFRLDKNKVGVEGFLYTLGKILGRM